MSEPQPSPPASENNQNPDTGKTDPQFLEIVRAATASANEVIEKQFGDRRTSIENATPIPTSTPHTQSASASVRPPLLHSFSQPPPRTPIPIQAQRTSTPNRGPAVATVPQYHNVYGDQFGSYRRPAAASPPGAASPSPNPPSPVVSRGYGDQFGTRRQSPAVIASPILPVSRRDEGQFGMSRSPPAAIASPFLPVRGNFGTNKNPAAIPSPSPQVSRRNEGQFGTSGSSPAAIPSPILPVSRVHFGAHKNTPPAIPKPSPQVSRGNDGQFGSYNTTPAAIASPILPVSRDQFGTYNNTPPAIPSPSSHVSGGYYPGDQYGTYRDPPVASPGPSTHMSRGYEYAGGNGNGNGQSFVENGWRNHAYPPIMPAPSLSTPNYGLPALTDWSPSTPGRQEIGQFGTPERRSVTEQPKGNSPESARARQVSIPRTPGRELPRVGQRNQTPSIGNFDLGHRYTPQKGREPTTIPEEGSVPRNVPSLAAARSKAVADLLNEDFVIRFPKKLGRNTRRYEPESDLSDEDFVVRKTPRKGKKTAASAVTRTETAADLSDEDFVVRRPNFDPNFDPCLDPALSTSRVEFQNSTWVERARSREKSVEETLRRHSKSPPTVEQGAVRQSDDSTAAAARSREQLAGSPPSRARTRAEISYNSSDEETLIDSEVEGVNRE